MAAKMSFYVEAPLEKVFDFFMDPSNQVDYPPFSDMKVLDAKVTKEGIGTYMSWSVKMAGIPMRGFEVVTDFTRNEHIVEMSSNAMVGTWEYWFAAEGSGTRITMEHRPRSVWALPLVGSLTDYATKRMSRAYIDAVKPELESERKVPSQRKPAATRSKKAAASR